MTLFEDVTPVCDICDEEWEDGGEGEDWNGDTGCHVSCEEERDNYDPPDSVLLRDSESIGSGGARDSDASYRSEMRDAGRGSLLR